MTCLGTATSDQEHPGGRPRLQGLRLHLPGRHLRRLRRLQLAGPVLPQPPGAQAHHDRRGRHLRVGISKLFFYSYLNNRNLRTGVISNV